MLERLNQLLEAATFLFISVPLTARPTPIWVPPSFGETATIFVKLARGEIVQERASYDHGQASNFTACIDARGLYQYAMTEFCMELLFLDLPKTSSPPPAQLGTG